MRWCDILPRILDAQKEHQMCIHVAELSELGQYNLWYHTAYYFLHHYTSKGQLKQDPGVWGPTNHSYCTNQGAVVR